MRQIEGGQGQTFTKLARNISYKYFSIKVTYYLISNTKYMNFSFPNPVFSFHTTLYSKHIEKSIEKFYSVCVSVCGVCNAIYGFRVIL